MIDAIFKYSLVLHCVWHPKIVNDIKANDIGYVRVASRKWY